MSNGSSGRPSRFAIDRGEVFDLLRAEHRDEQRLDLLFGDLAVELELALDVGRGGRAVRVACRTARKTVEQRLVARVGSRSAGLGARRTDSTSAPGC